jgi:hypothetical protein
MDGQAAQPGVVAQNADYLGSERMTRGFPAVGTKVVASVGP